MGTLSREASHSFFISFSCFCRVNLNHIALRKTKIVYNFGLSECSRVKGKELALLRVDSSLDCHSGKQAGSLESFLSL